ncbi:hypothetical protein PC129_g15121 [Phytophthora cactorum]|uniref:DDE-1 domain-containing protein n=2 Tax=Phytophthora cactorum TaxID=29920 RepID=A0A8T1HP38_9STRA|nr:hypothetical protein PC112_g4027 [Phytophthora cactorum]KAG2843992.1 hypothetical protein PC111_g2166 [Phytophthora cactorum]KAG2865924.1 hypothetical protein PC113_g3302 [Phytophthora cactorum]KAG2928201.1 hypothetical protein PC114_g3198 [Phytophthora cactorum]KAG2971343.1 hypothetical protein PC118_g16335 [Phytophthora cactorum]
MESVANVFSHSILRTVEEDGILSFLKGTEKYSSVYNMDQTAIYVDMNGRTTVDFVGASTVDVVQATGAKLPPLIVYAGVPGGPVSQKLFNPSFGAETVEHTAQKNAYCDGTVMLDWIERVWKPSVDGCKLLLLDSLKTHKMAPVRYAL